MQKILATLAFLCFAGMLKAQQDIIARNPDVITGTLVKITKPLKDFTPADAAIADVRVRDANGIIGNTRQPRIPHYVPGVQQANDEGLQTQYPNRLNNSGITPEAAITANFNGIGNQPLNPPDPTLCVGPNHVIQMVNGSSGALLQIYNKSGTVLVATKFMDAITGRGGLGDPIALYDQLADRYFISEFNNASETGSEGLTIAISQTNDPTGSWYVYFFSTGSIFPDYPKFSVWNDAYYATTNDFTASYVGSTVYAFDRTKMIAGNTTATMQKFTLGSANKHFSMCPVLLQGTALPPAGTGGLITYMNDNSWTGSATDSIGMFEFRVNWTTPSASVVVARSSLAVSAYKSDVCTATRGQCIAMPGTTSRLEALHQRVMNQPIYRNFGTHEGIVLCHAVDKGSNIAGVRWYELRKTTGNWSVNQQSTYSPDNTHRWMASVCYDAAGNIGLAYNVSASTSVFPGARYTGRKSCDALNSMTFAETLIVAGSASNGSTRYGDYNHLVADPDGVRFWFTCEYNPASAWSTRIAAFTLDNCTPVNCGDPTGLNSSSITTTSATLSWTAVSGALNYNVDYQVTGGTTWTNIATATTATSVNATGLSAGTNYTWRVQATCSAGSGNYVTASFTTLATCNAPSGLSSSGISSSGATVSWAAVSGASSYAVDYKTSAASTWTTATASTTSTSFSLTGLSASTLYDWRVRATCASGTSAYAQAQFTTTAGSTCGSAFEPNETQATAATISSGVANSAAITTSTDNDYFKITTTVTSNITYSLVGPSGVDYDMQILNSAGTVIGSGTGATATETVTLNNQAAGTYTIRIFGYNGANSASCYTITATATSSSCASPLDNTTNGTISGAATIPFNTDVRGLISPSGDNDYYRFVITTGGTATVTLTTLPADYDLTIVNSAGTQLAISQNGSTTSETISRTYTAGTYYARVYGYNGANSATSCYTLRVALGTASRPELEIKETGLVKLYPNPVSDVLNISVLGKINPKAVIHVTDLTGKTVLTRNVVNNPQAVDIKSLPNGVYFVKVTNGDKVLTSKFTKQ